MVVNVHETYDGYLQIVGFNIFATSIPEDENRLYCKAKGEGLVLSDREETNVTFTYSIKALKF